MQLITTGFISERFEEESLKCLGLNVFQKYYKFSRFKILDPASNDIITLSDFNVSLEEITLKWNVSTLEALYYNSPTWGFKALLEDFKS